jgi:hypothetical protein
MKRGEAEYGPGSSGPTAGRVRFLRTAQLNVVGWGALVLACVGVAAVAYPVARLAGWSGGPVQVVAAAVVGTVVVVSTVVAVDRRRWGSLQGIVSWTDDDDEVQRVADGLRERGVDVGLVLGVEHPELLYRNRDRAVVRAALADVGVEMPSW